MRTLVRCNSLVFNISFSCSRCHPSIYLRVYLVRHRPQACVSDTEIYLLRSNKLKHSIYYNNWQRRSKHLLSDTVFIKLIIITWKLARSLSCRSEMCVRHEKNEPGLMCVIARRLFEFISNFLITIIIKTFFGFIWNSSVLLQTRTRLMRLVVNFAKFWN